jgi:hypothetical protein
MFYASNNLVACEWPHRFRLLQNHSRTVHVPYLNP